MASGEPILLTYFHLEKILQANVVRLVSDTPELIAMYWGTSYPMKASAVTQAERREIHTRGREYRLVETAWEFSDVLCLVRPGEGHASWLMWKAGTREEVCWYINMQEPLKRTNAGFESRDHELDIVVEPDLNSWRWKDEDELEVAVKRRWLTPARARSIRAEGEKALDAVRERAPPFDGSWKGWQPDAAWTIPEPPSRWTDL